MRCRRKDLAKFLGVEEVPTMERVKGSSLDSSSDSSYSIPSYSSSTSNFTSGSSSRSPSMTSSEDQMSTKM